MNHFFDMQALVCNSGNASIVHFSFIHHDWSPYANTTDQPDLSKRDWSCQKQAAHVHHTREER